MAIKVESRFTTQKLRPKIERPQKWGVNGAHLDTATISLSPSEGERAGVRGWFAFSMAVSRWTPLTLAYACALALLGLICSQSCAANLQWVQDSGYRSAALPVPKQGRTGFTLLPPGATGINFTNILTDDKTAENQLRLNGSGVACGDVDGDGWCDVYLCGLENGNRLYRNLGAWKFEDITESAGVACADQYCTGAVFADVDGNGSLDLLVNGVGVGTRLFLNDGKGHFHEATESGLA